MLMISSPYLIQIFFFIMGMGPMSLPTCDWQAGVIFQAVYMSTLHLHGRLHLPHWQELRAINHGVIRKNIFLCSLTWTWAWCMCKCGSRGGKANKKGCWIRVTLSHGSLMSTSVFFSESELAFFIFSFKMTAQNTNGLSSTLDLYQGYNPE